MTSSFSCPDCGHAPHHETGPTCPVLRCLCPRPAESTPEIRVEHSTLTRDRTPHEPAWGANGVLSRTGPPELVRVFDPVTQDTSVKYHPGLPLVPMSDPPPSGPRAAADVLWAAEAWAEQSLHNRMDATSETALRLLHAVEVWQ